MADISCREYDVQNRAAIDYYKSLSVEEIDRLIAAREKEIQDKSKTK